jgi:hypothetical protein
VDKTSEGNECRARSTDRLTLGRTRRGTARLARQQMKWRSQSLVVPPIAAILGCFWLLAAVNHFERATHHELKGIIGFNYSQPEFGFQYRPEGRRIELWAFTIPSSVILGVLLLSAVAASLTTWREVGWPGVLGIWFYHFIGAVVFGVLLLFFWTQAVDVFI